MAATKPGPDLSGSGKYANKENPKREPAKEFEDEELTPNPPHVDAGGGPQTLEAKETQDEPRQANHEPVVPREAQRRDPSGGGPDDDGEGGRDAREHPPVSWSLRAMR